MRRIIILFLLVSLFASCSPAPTATVAPSATPPPPTPTITAPGARAFLPGITAALPGLAGVYARAGVQAAVLQPSFTTWGNLEPQPGQFEWAALDGLVSEYQAAGFAYLQMVLSAASPWASRAPAPSGGKDIDSFPRDEYQDDYSAFVARVVERYDGDGQEDMPYLRYPITMISVETELGEGWPGRMEDYLRLLRLAYTAAHRAAPNAMVMPGGLLLADVFDGAPEPAAAAVRLELNRPYRKTAVEIRQLVAACETYDALNLYSLGDYSEIPAAVAWARAEMAANACPERPVYIGDAVGGSAMMLYGGTLMLRPAADADRGRLLEVLKSAADPRAAGYDAALTWLYAQSAREVIQKMAVAAASGARGVNIGYLEDSLSGVPAVDSLGGTLPQAGMTAIVVGLNRPYGDLPFAGSFYARQRVAGAQRPAFQALALAAQKLGRITAARRLEGLPPGVWAGLFASPEGTLVVAWYDDGSLTLPGEPLPALETLIPLDGKTALVTLPPLLPGETEAQTVQTVIQQGGVSLKLDRTPVFIEVR